MKAVVFTLGCKVNDVESGSIIRGLEQLGYKVLREMETADLYIINTIKSIDFKISYNIYFVSNSIFISN